MWGVRGSYPAPGPHTLDYGGNTPCIEVQAGATRLIVDAGTGIYALGQQLAGEPAHHTLLFSHIHWDHIQGLPAFQPLMDPDCQITLMAPSRFLPLLQDLFGHTSRHLTLPLPPNRLRAKVQFRAFQTGESFQVGDIQVGSVRLNHPYLCAGFCFRAGGRSVAFYSDTAPFSDILFGYEFHPEPPEPDTQPDPYEQRRLAQMKEEAVALIRGADLLICDAHFTPAEYPRFAHFGHSTPEHALDLAAEAGVRWLMLYHHAPTRSDRELAEIEAHFKTAAQARSIRLTAAREGDRITL